MSTEYDCLDWHPTSIGPLGLDYEYFYICEMENYQTIATILMVFWVIYMIRTLGGTASSYLSPTLANVCDRFKVPYDLAGVTLLAFGNGAPDVFASIASFSGSGQGDGGQSSADSVLVGLGSLLGGGVFVTTVVVGAIAYFCPCEVSKHIFTRDIGFHILAVTALAIVGIFGRINIWTSIGLFLLYILYVGVVFSFMWMAKTENMTDIQLDDLSLKSLSASPIQTAFWHKQTNIKNSSSSNNSSNNNRSNSNYNSKLINSLSSKSSSNNSLSKSLSFTSGSVDAIDGGLFGGGSLGSELNMSTGYTFLILEDEPNEPYTGRQGNAMNSLGGGYGRVNDDDDDDDDDDDSLASVSGGGNVFDGVIIEDYFGGCDSSTPHLAYAEGDDGYKDLENHNYQSGSVIHGDTNLTQSLLPKENNVIKSDHNSGNSSNHINSGGNNKQIPVVKGSDLHSRVLAAIYWKQKALANHFKKGLLSIEFWELSPLDKAVWMLDFPSDLMRSLTIPTLYPEQWNKYLAIVQPIAGFLFFGFCLGDIESYPLGIPYILMAFLVALPFSALIYLLTHYNYPPSGKVVELIWIFWSFFMCILWIYVVAKELVSCLSSLGAVLSISPSFLGLTVLAWGNSVGDFFANTAVAKRGLGQMALAGCYGGPVFNILIGLGIAFALASGQTYPDSYPVEFDTSSVISVVFLYISLGSTLALVIYNNYRLDKKIGIYLGCVYVTYTICQVILVNYS